MNHFFTRFLGVLLISIQAFGAYSQNGVAPPPKEKKPSKWPEKGLKNNARYLTGLGFYLERVFDRSSPASGSIYLHDISRQYNYSIGAQDMSYTNACMIASFEYPRWFLIYGIGFGLTKDKTLENIGSASSNTSASVYGSGSFHTSYSLRVLTPFVILDAKVAYKVYRKNALRIGIGVGIAPRFNSKNGYPSGLLILKSMSSHRSYGSTSKSSTYDSASPIDKQVAMPLYGFGIVAVGHFFIEAKLGMINSLTLGVQGFFTH